jgi:putative oxidoreductase
LVIGPKLETLGAYARAPECVSPGLGRRPDLCGRRPPFCCLWGGPAAVGARVAAPQALEPVWFWGALLIFLETIGGLLIAVGLFTRVIAALLFIEFLVIWKVHARRGWAASASGLEFVVMWGLLFLVLMLRGGGPYSADRKLGWEI